jgi:MFS family permease
MLQDGKPGSTIMRDDPTRAVALFVAVLLVIAVVRIVSTYFVFPQAYDEPAHVVCGMEWLDNGTFTLEPLHPPLPRVAAALGPYLAGIRLPEVQLVRDKKGTNWYDIYPAGTEILNAGGHYFRNLTLARLGELPFFFVAVAVVFFWARKLHGPWPAAFAVLLFTTIPTILAFAGLTYVDFSLGALLPFALFAFTRWLEAPTIGRSGVLGLAIGLSVIANFTALLFLPVCLIPILICWWWFGGRAESNFMNDRRLFAGALAVALAVTFLVIWGGYRFSVKRLDQVFAKPVDDVGRLPVPHAVKQVALKIVDLNPSLPAPGFLKGIVEAWMANKESPPAYALGHVRRGGFWYFYWLALGVKTPLALLLLTSFGIAFALFSSKRDWRIMAPAVSVLAILAVAMVVKVNLGIRHILFIYPLMSLTAIGFAVFLWERRRLWPQLVALTLLGLFGWQIVASAAIHPDYIAYFNEIATRHKDDYLLFGCDLDCGQDLWRLTHTLKARGITRLSIKLETSADLSRMDLPPFHVLEPYERATGWVAASVLFTRTGRAMWDLSDPQGWAWLNAYQPVQQVGNTIRLYNIPEDSAALPRVRPPHSQQAPRPTGPYY